MSGVYWALSKVIDGYSDHVEWVTASPARKGKTSRKHRLKVKKVRWQEASDLKIPNGKICFSLLEKSVPSEFREELLREVILESVDRLVHILMVV